MHDFRQKDPDDMFIPELRDSTSHFEKTKEERDRMGAEIEEYAEKKSRTREITASIGTCRDINPKMTNQHIKEYFIKKYDLTEAEADSFFTPIPA